MSRNLKYLIKGPNANKALIQAAIKVAPAIFVDCANCTNIHKLQDDFNLNKLYILPAETLYRFKPTLLKLPYFAQKIGTKQIFISTIGHLFDYGNEIEQQSIVEQCEKIIDWLSKNYQLTIAWDIQIGHKE